MRGSHALSGFDSFKDLHGLAKIATGSNGTGIDVSGWANDKGAVRTGESIDGGTWNHGRLFHPKIEGCMGELPGFETPVGIRNGGLYKKGSRVGIQGGAETGNLSGKFLSGESHKHDGDGHPFADGAYGPLWNFQAKPKGIDGY